MRKKDLIQVLTSIGLLIIGYVLSPVNDIVSSAFVIAAYILAGYEVLWEAAKNICHGKVLDENFLMTIATIGAFVLGEFGESAAVMIFYQIGENFQRYAVNKSRRSIKDLMEISPDYANVMVDGQLVQKDPEDIEVGETIYVLPGERIAMDGTIVEGTTLLDTSALTGESVHRDATVGDEVLSGSINTTSTIAVKTEKAFEDSTANRILELVETASDKKSKAENFISKFARYYTPIVIGAALALSIIPPAVVGWNQFPTYLYRALNFLVISCPCALVISVPLAFFGGLGAASRKGILIKGSNYVEMLSRLDTVVFDKTGTLTKGVFRVTEINPVGISEEKLLELAALCENFSNHPIAISLRGEYGKSIDAKRIYGSTDIQGKGIIADTDLGKIMLGNRSLMEEKNVDYVEIKKSGTSVYVVLDGKYVGSILISDQIKDNIREDLDELRRVGIKKTVMLTGDSRSVADEVSQQLGIDVTYSQLLPQDKVSRIEELIGQGTVGFVGDGINDAPVLARADVGISMGQIGSDAAIEASDVVLTDDSIRKIADAVRLSRKTIRISKENIVFALGVKILVLILSAVGITSMWYAIFADVGVALIAILNSMRMLKAK